jgi:hypothetical protein
MKIWRVDELAYDLNRPIAEKFTMPKLTHLLHFTAALLFAARLCQAECIPEHAPPQPNQDALARLLKAQDQCPATTPDFLNVVEGSGAKLETTMVNFLVFDNPNPGVFFLFQIVSGRLAGPNLSVERGDLLFGHCHGRLKLAT